MKRFLFSLVCLPAALILWVAVLVLMLVSAVIGGALNAWEDAPSSD